MSTVRVLLTRDENIPSGTPLSDYTFKGKTHRGFVKVIDRADYILCVVCSEMSRGWAPTAYSCGAITANTYLEDKTSQKIHPDFDITDMSEYHQAYKESRIRDECREPVRYVSGLILSYEDEPIKAYYYASNNGYTKKLSEPPWSGRDVEYLKHKSDSYGKPPSGVGNGHGYGMAQWGAQNRALDGQSVREILHFYYEGAKLIELEEKEEVDVMEDFTLHQCILEHNDCYKSGRTIVPCGIMVHSTGANNKELRRYIAPNDGIIGENQYNNHWNQPDHSKCVHGFIGEGVDGNVYTYQTLPFTMRGWHAGGDANSLGYIGFEIQESNTSDVDYFNESYRQAVLFCAHLCQEYNLTETDIISHKEGRLMGIASNHGDADSWFKPFGKDMNKFREEVALVLNDGVVVEPVEPPIDTRYPEYYSVDVNNYLNVRTSPNGTVIGRLYPDEIVKYHGQSSSSWKNVLGDNISGWVHGDYLEQIDNPNDEDEDNVEVPDPEDGDTFDKIEMSEWFKELEEIDSQIDEHSQIIDELTDKGHEIREKMKEHLKII